MTTPAAWPTTINGRKAVLYVAANTDGPWVPLSSGFYDATVEWSSDSTSNYRIWPWRYRYHGRLTRAARLMLARAAGLPLRSRARRRAHRRALKRRGRL